MFSILLAEDDAMQAQWLKEVLLDRLNRHDPRITTVRWELEFREALDTLAAAPPNLYLVDVMLRWTTPSENIPVPPPDVQRTGVARAGIRCARLVRERVPGFSPIVLYTVLDASEGVDAFEDLPLNTHHLAKAADERALMDLITSHTSLK